jgi:hypothetical protein
VETGVQKIPGELEILDSGFRRNDGKRGMPTFNDDVIFHLRWNLSDLNVIVNKGKARWNEEHF